MSIRRKAATAVRSTPHKPDYFPSENVLTGYTAPQLLALGREFEQYRFVGCDLTEANLANLRFEDCLFERCNLSSARLQNTGLQNVAFADCKLLGASFAACQDMLLALHFDHCQLRYASFAGKRLTGTRFAACSLAEADFTNADLSRAVFADCDLTNTIFHQTQLAEADFTSATGFSIDPEANTLTGARFALTGLPRLLEKYGLVIEA